MANHIQLTTSALAYINQLNSTREALMSFFRDSQLSATATVRINLYGTGTQTGVFLAAKSMLPAMIGEYQTVTRKLEEAGIKVEAKDMAEELVQKLLAMIKE